MPGLYPFPFTWVSLVPDREDFPKKISYFGHLHIGFLNKKLADVKGRVDCQRTYEAGEHDIIIYGPT